MGECDAKDLVQGTEAIWIEAFGLGSGGVEFPFVLQGAQVDVKGQQISLGEVASLGGGGHGLSGLANLADSSVGRSGSRACSALRQPCDQSACFI